MLQFGISRGIRALRKWRSIPVMLCYLVEFAICIINDICGTYVFC